MERDQALKHMHDLLRLMVQKGGSDLFITSNFPPRYQSGRKNYARFTADSQCTTYSGIRARDHE